MKQLAQRFLAVVITFGVVMQALPLCAATRTMLWQSREQFVALEPTGSHPTVNLHPYNIASERLGTLLMSLRVRTPDQTAPVPVFTRESLDVLVPYLRSALEQARPDQDITFAVIGLHSAMYGLAKTGKVTTGRLFINRDGLNILFGMVQHDYNERDDRRLAPFVQGVREEVAVGDWQFQTDGAGNVRQIRKDWLVIDTSWQPPPGTTGEPHAPPVLPKHAVSPSTQTPSVAPHVQQIQERRSISDRLIILNDLKREGLISEEEYKSKRAAILSEL